jgi:hypothetical protein
LRAHLAEHELPSTCLGRTQWLDLRDWPRFMRRLIRSNHGTTPSHGHEPGNASEPEVVYRHRMHHIPPSGHRNSTRLIGDSLPRAN